MTEEHLHKIEEMYEGALCALDDLVQKYPNISFEPLRARLDGIGTILSASALAMDEPDESPM